MRLDISGRLNRDGGALEIGGIPGNYNVDVAGPGGFVQDGILEIPEWQTQCTYQHCFVDRGDFEKESRREIPSRAASAPIDFLIR